MCRVRLRRRRWQRCVSISTWWRPLLIPSKRKVLNNYYIMPSRERKSVNKKYPNIMKRTYINWVGRNAYNSYANTNNLKLNNTRRNRLFRRYIIILKAITACTISFHWNKTDRECWEGRKIKNQKSIEDCWIWISSQIKNQLWSTKNVDRMLNQYVT